MLYVNSFVRHLPFGYYEGFLSIWAKCSFIRVSFSWIHYLQQHNIIHNHLKIALKTKLYLKHAETNLSFQMCLLIIKRRKPAPSRFYQNVFPVFFFLYLRLIPFRFKLANIFGGYKREFSIYIEVRHIHVRNFTCMHKCCSLGRQRVVKSSQCPKINLFFRKIWKLHSVAIRCNCVFFSEAMHWLYLTEWRADFVPVCLRSTFDFKSHVDQYCFWIRFGYFISKISSNHNEWIDHQKK